MIHWFKFRFHHLLSLSTIAAVTAAVGLLQAVPPEASAAAMTLAKAEQLEDLSLEDLMQVEVYSASKQLETVMTTASAIYVITHDDIRKSGVSSLVDALRLAPGVQVSTASGGRSAVSIRGFAGPYSNKLLVLQDGRTIYSPRFSGVFWNAQEIMLEDIEQIEIIRGPAATLWGVNAVNGVINITTKKARDTQGGLIAASGGTIERASTAMRYGAKIGEDFHMRAYGKYFHREVQNLFLPTNDTPDIWSDWRGGFRAEWDATPKNSFTLQGDIYNDRLGRTMYNGGNALGRWNSTISDTSNLSLQMFYDRTYVGKRFNPEMSDHETRNTGDIELQHTFALSSWNRFIWGAGFRLTADRMNSNTTLMEVYNPTSRTERIFTAFLQDRITFLPDTLHLILGGRAEHNTTTGWEFQPTARLLFTPNEQHTLWGAVSRAARTPSRAETTISAMMSPPDPANFVPEVRLLGNRNLHSEKLIAYEVGYRYQPLPTLSFDLALFYNDYSSLIGVAMGEPVGMPPTLVPVNAMQAATAIGRGGELAVSWRPVAWTDLTLAYSYLDLKVFTNTAPILNEGVDYNRTVMNADTAPRHQLSFISTVDLPKNVTWTFWLRYVGGIPAFPDVPGYVTCDTRIAWKPLPKLELSLVGQNLIEPRHREFGTDMFENSATPVERSMYGKVTWSF